MTVTVEDLIMVMQEVAPSRLAEKWDNVGLQVGQKDWSVKTVWIALDPLPEVIEASCQAKIDLLITHHPLILNPLKSIDFNLPIGKSIRLAAENRLAIYSAHTNFDSVSGGLNDIFARRIGLKNMQPLIGDGSDLAYKLVVFTPVGLEQELLDTLIQSSTNKVVGNNRFCSFRTRGKGTFINNRGVSGEIGKTDHRNEVEEVRIESVISASDLPIIVDRLRTYPLYETVEYDVYPLVQPKAKQGIGRWGELPAETDLKSLALHVKNVFGLKTIRMVGEPDLVVKVVAICTGSGGSLLPRFLASSADVFISGDLRYHDARDAQAARRGLIDIGHFASEHIMVPELTSILNTAVNAKGLDVRVSSCALERDPFVSI